MASTRWVTTTDGVRLEVEDEGEGPVVLLLHGFPDDRQGWDGVAARLVAAGHRVVRYDQRGFGASDAPEGRRHYAIDRIVRDAVEVLDAVGASEPVVLVGHDWGALIAWALALAEPGRIRRHIAISVGHPSAYRAAGLEQKRRGIYIAGFLLVGIAERRLKADGFALMRRWMPLHPDPGRVVGQMGRPGRLTAGLNWYRRNVVTIFTRRWARSTVPTMGIWSDGDAYLTHDQMAASERHVDAPWELVVVPGAGHWVPDDRPDEVAALIARWGTTA